MDKPNDLHDHYDEMLDVLTKDDAHVGNKKSGPFQKYFAMQGAYEFIVLHTLINSAKDLLSHENVKSVSFEINQDYSSGIIYTSLNAYVDWVLHQDGEEESGYICCYHGEIDVDDIPEELDEEQSPDFYKKLEYFASCMEYLDPDLLKNHDCLLNKKLHYESASSYLKDTFPHFSTLLEKDYLSKQINSQDEKKTKKVKIL